MKEQLRILYAEKAQVLKDIEASKKELARV